MAIEFKAVMNSMRSEAFFKRVKEGRRRDAEQARQGMILLRLLLLCLIFLQPGLVLGIEPGELAPPFSLPSIHGESHSLTAGNGRYLQVLYFFDPASSPSRSGLLVLNRLVEGNSKDLLRVWGIAMSPKDQIEAQLQGVKTDYPVLVASEEVDDLYDARTVIPICYVLDSDLKILGVIVGGGRSSEIPMEELIEGHLKHLNTAVEESFDTLKETAIEAFNNKHYREAQELLLKALEVRSDPSVYLYLAHCQMELDQKAELGKTLSEGIATYPEEIRLYGIYARYLLGQGEQKKALATLNKALQIKPDDINLKLLKESVESMGGN